MTVTFPAAFSSESYKDLEDHLKIFLRKAKRRAGGDDEAANQGGAWRFAMALRMSLLKIGGAIVICAGSFWATLRVLDYRDAANSGPGIRLVEATYGPNCGAKVGNFTALMTQACASSTAACSFTVDLSKTGDPAAGCGKDFLARWKCGSDPSVYERRLPPEANSKTITIGCPAK